MTKRTKETMGVLLCVLAMMGCEEADKSQLLAPNLQDPEPVEVYVLNQSGLEATLRLELPTGVMALGDVPALGVELLSLDDAQLMGGAVIRILSDTDASDWFWVQAGSDVQVLLEQDGDVTASTVKEQEDPYPHGIEWF